MAEIFFWCGRVLMVMIKALAGHDGDCFLVLWSALGCHQTIHFWMWPGLVQG
jgi:hypothetical protein